jgi:hypothetical protein
MESIRWLLLFHYGPERERDKRDVQDVIDFKLLPSTVLK